jgi:Ni,Fe-hydrogenase III large subunit
VSEPVLDHDRYRAAIGEALSEGARVASLYATEDSGSQLVRVVLCDPAGDLRIVTVAANEGRVPTIVDLAGAVGFAEREAHDLHGVSFVGHEPLRPLVDHTAPLSQWTVPVDGADAYQVAVGPIHAGIIESGHFRFHVVGDRILHLDAQLFYKHRGLERAAVGAPLDDAIAFAARACGACAVTNRVAYAHAAEQLRGLLPEPELARARTILLELERLWSHLNDIAAICAGAGAAAGEQRFSALGEDARRLNERLTGHRLLFGTVSPGGSDLELDGDCCRAARASLSEIRDALTSAWRSLSFNTSFQDRLIGVGVLAAADARELGAVGPAARASGVGDDARSAAGALLAYGDFHPALNRRLAGDVRARFEQRELELHQTLDLLDELLQHPLGRAACRAGGVPSAIGIGRVESPRGATVCVLEPAGESISRMHLRTGSFANWPVLAHVASGELLPDFPLINKSFELCYACADR